MAQAALQMMTDVLGIPPAGQVRTSPMRIIDLIEQGLPLASLDRVAATVSPGDPSFKHRIVPRATLARLRRGDDARLSAEASGRLARIARVWALAKDVWKSSEEARAYLERPHPLLDGRRPLDVVIGTDIGAQMVEDILGRLQFGNAA